MTEILATHPLLLITIGLCSVSILILAYYSVVIVSGNAIAVLERRWIGKKMPQGRVVAMGGEGAHLRAGNALPDPFPVRRFQVRLHGDQ